MLPLTDALYSWKIFQIAYAKSHGANLNYLEFHSAQAVWMSFLSFDLWIYKNRNSSRIDPHQ